MASPGYRIFDRGETAPAADASTGLLARADAGDAIAVRLIEPMQGNAAALGVNGLSIPAARAAILQTIDSGQPAATAGFRLTQQDSDDKHVGIVIYQAIYDVESAGAPSAEPLCAAWCS